MIQLKEKTPIASGTNRACYIHPEDWKKCIKITISGDYKESKREIGYYKFLDRKNISWDMLAKFYGTVDTDLGTGEVVELILDYNGNVSNSLDYYFRYLNSIDEITKFIKLLLELNNYLYSEKIYVKDLNAVNIVYQKYNQTDGRLVIIDGLAHSSYIPFGRYIDMITTTKIKESWEHLIYKLKKRSATKYSPHLKTELEKWNL